MAQSSDTNEDVVTSSEPRVLARYFKEDLIYRLDNRGRGQVGLVVMNCENDSDTEDDESHDEYSSCERVSKGQAKVLWYPSGTSEMVDEDSVKLFDRSLLTGDVVRSLHQQGGQLGFVSACKVELTLRILGTNKVIADVDADDFIHLFPVQENEVILYKDWLGYVNEIEYVIIVQEPNGLMFSLHDCEYWSLEKVYNEHRDNLNFESLPYVGELLWAEPQKLVQFNLLKSSPDASPAITPPHFIKIRRKNKVLLQVISVCLSKIEVRWLSHKPAAATDALEPTKPGDVIDEETISSIKPVNHFKSDSLQTPDRGYYVIKDSDTIISYDDWSCTFDDEPSEASVTAASTQPLSTPSENEPCVTRHRHKRRRPSVPVSKASLSMYKFQGQSTRKPKIQTLVDMTPGSRVAVEIIATQMTATVTWQDGTVEENISSVDLYPVHHVNDHEFFPGDFVVENKDDFEFPIYGVIQAVCRAERTAIVNWFRILLPSEVSVAEKSETVSVYDIKDHPDFQYRPGSIVMRIDNKKDTDVESAPNQSIEATIGQLIKFLPSGKLYCKWMNDTYEAVDPQAVFHISDSDPDDFFSELGESDEDIDEFLENSITESEDKETSLSELFDAVNVLEQWFTRNTTVNIRNGVKVSRLLCNFVKALQEVGQHSHVPILKSEEIKDLIDLSQPPAMDSLPRDTPIARLIDRVYKVIEENAVTDAPINRTRSPTTDENLDSYDSPVSRRTKGSLSVLHKIKQRLFPLCNAHSSTESTTEDSIETENSSQSMNESQSEVTESTIGDEETPSLNETSASAFFVNKVSFMESVPDCHKFKLSKFDPVNPKEFNSTWRKEIKLLSASLPDEICVKAFHDRMDLISFMIVGPKNTPYEDGLFLFDVQLPAKYPHVPPLVHYISFCNDRLNPNLYESGKVCVSLLGTWNGKGYEVWCPSASTLLQVIISIQGLILVPEPYFNEAGYLKQRETDVGCENSRLYNEMAVVKVTQSMARMFSHPPETFKEEIISHARARGQQFLSRLQSWTSLETPAPLTEFPLLPPSKGFRLSLLRAISELDEVLRKISQPMQS